MATKLDEEYTHTQEAMKRRKSLAVSSPKFKNTTLPLRTYKNHPIDLHCLSDMALNHDHAYTMVRIMKKSLVEWQHEPIYDVGRYVTLYVAAHIRGRGQCVQWGLWDLKDVDHLL